MHDVILQKIVHLDDSVLKTLSLTQYMLGSLQVYNVNVGVSKKRSSGRKFEIKRDIKKHASTQTKGWIYRYKNRQIDRPRQIRLDG